MWLHLVFEGGQQLFEVVELPRVQQQLGVKLVGTDGGVLPAQLVQLKVRHHLHVLLDQSSVGVKVSWLLWRESGRLDSPRRQRRKIREGVGGSEEVRRQEGCKVTLSMSLLMALSFSLV